MSMQGRVSAKCWVLGEVLYSFASELRRWRLSTKTGLSGGAHVYLLSEVSAHPFAGVSPSSNYRYNQFGSRIPAPPFSIEREMRQGPQIVKERKDEWIWKSRKKMPLWQMSFLCQPCISFKSIFSGISSLLYGWERWESLDMVPYSHHLWWHK